jgi:multiple sugar transport system substrate-binding protein
VRQHGQELYTDEGTLGFDEELLVEWWDLWADLREEGVAPPADIQIESEGSGQTNDLLAHSQVGIRLSSATHLRSLGDLRDGGLSIQDYPETADAAADWRFYTPLLLTAAANTPDPELAAELINTLVNDEDAANITKLSMGTPTPTGVAEAILPELPEVEQEIVTFLNEQQTHPSRPTALLPETSEQFTSSLTRFSQEVAYGRMSPEEAATALFADADRYLD